MAASPENIVLIRVLDSKAPYQIQLTVRDPSVFAGVMQDPRFQGKSDEQLLTALLEAYKTQIVEIERYNAQGKCNDGPKGQPASQMFNEDGVMILQRRFCEGHLQDSQSGEAAVLEYDGNRVLRVKEHHQGGKVSDGAKGEPSITTYAPDGSFKSSERFANNLYDDSAIGEPAMVLYDHFERALYVEHFCQGRLNDSITGEPATKQFNDAGQLLAAARYKMGDEVGELSQDEIETYNAANRSVQQGPKRPSSLQGPKP